MIPCDHRAIQGPMVSGDERIQHRFDLCPATGTRTILKAMKAICRIALSALALFLVGGCALQQDLYVLEERVQELELENHELRKKLHKDLNSLGVTREKSEKNMRAQYATMNVNMDTMQQDLRLLNGRLEEIEYLLNRKVGSYEADSQKNQKRLDEMTLKVAKVDERIAALEQYLSIERKGRAAPRGDTTGQKPSKKATSDAQLYSDARQAYDSGDMDKARQIFQKLIKSYPKSENADNAQFWVAESYYREKWYERAILEYQTVIEKYPKGNKVPAAMLKQGMSFLKIGDKSNARIILKELVKKYPKTNEADVAAKRLKEF